MCTRFQKRIAPLALLALLGLSACDLLDVATEEADANKEADPSAVLYAVEIGDRWGYMNKTGEIVIEPQYAYALSFTDGLGAVELCLDVERSDYCDESRWGFVDSSGDFAIQAQYEAARPFFKGLARVYYGDETYGFIDRSGQLVIRPGVHDVHGYLSDGLIRVEDEEGNEVRFIDAEGNVKLDLKDTINQEFEAYLNLDDSTNYYYHEHPEVHVGDFSEGLVRVRLETQYSWYSHMDYREYYTEVDTVVYLDKEGDVAFYMDYGLGADSTVVDGGGFHGGLAWVKVRDDNSCSDYYCYDYHYLYGYIDAEGKRAIEARFYGAGAFAEVDGRKLAPAMDRHEKWGYIDERGAWVIEPQFENAAPFYEGLAAVTVGYSRGYVDKDGNYVHQPTRKR